MPELPAPPAELPKEEPKAEDPPKEEPKADDPPKEEEPKDPAPAVPETYEISVKDHEGKDVALDADLLAAATPIFKAANLTNEQAQQVAQFYAANVLPGVSNFVQQQTLELLGIADMGEWAAKLKADAEVGGAKYEENLTIIAQGRDAFATPELKTLLETTRLGNHPEVNRLFLKVGKLVKEGSVFGGGGGAAKAGGPEAFYDPAYSPKS